MKDFVDGWCLLLAVSVYPYLLIYVGRVRVNDDIIIISNDIYMFDKYMQKYIVIIIIIKSYYYCFYSFSEPDNFSFILLLDRTSQII